MLKVKEVISVLWVSGQVAVFVPVVVVGAVATMAWPPSSLLLGFARNSYNNNHHHLTVMAPPMCSPDCGNFNRPSFTLIK